jgi:hypothetical protein
MIFVHARTVAAAAVEQLPLDANGLNEMENQ